jgi:uncharacterized protein involved in exopolysaccharide biosynthesis
MTAPIGSDRGEISLSQLAARVARRRALLLGVALTLFAAVTLWAFVATPRYKSDARLRIESESQTPSPASLISDQVSSSVPGGGAGLLGSLGRDELETEVAVLQSDRISDAMIDSLALGVRVTKPAASRARVLTARTVDPTADVDAEIVFHRQPGGLYSADPGGHDDLPGLPHVFKLGVPVRVSGWLITLSPLLAGGGPDKIVVKLLPRYKVHKLLDKRLLISRQEGGSRLVEVVFEDPDRVLAQQVVQQIISNYVAYTTATERTEDTTAVGELRLQVDSTRRLLTASENALRVFEEQSRLIAPQEQAASEVKRVGEISTRVDAISAERDALSRMLTIIEDRSHGGADPAAYRQLATFPTLITNRAIQDLLNTLIGLENQRSALGVRRTDANPEYKQLSDRILEIDRQLFAVGPQYLESLDQELATTVHTVSALMDTLGAMPTAVTEFGRLVRDRTVYEATYIALQKQLKVAELKDVLRKQRVRVVDHPRVANVDDPAFPKKGVMVALGAVLAIMCAIAVGLVVELWG